MPSRAERQPPEATTAPEVILIDRALAGGFPNVSVYRYNPASIRIRVIDDRFKGMNRVERERWVRPLIRALPEDVQSDITILLLLAPEETSSSLMNIEFENPSPSML